MSEGGNEFLKSIDLDSNNEKQQYITESEWDKINADKNDILSKVCNNELKSKFESKYLYLENYFKQEGKQIHIITNEDLNLFRDFFACEIKSDFITNNEEVKSNLISKYSKQYKDLQYDIIDFLDGSFNNSLQSKLGDFNVLNFDNEDNKKGFSDFELSKYTSILNKAINNMHILGGYGEFIKKSNETGTRGMSFYGTTDIYLANVLNIQKHIGLQEEHLTDNLHNYSEEELISMRQEQFDIKDADKMKDFSIILGIEVGNNIQEVYKILFNCLSGLILLPRYISNKITLKDGTVDTEDEVIIEMENNMLLKENPSLMLLEIVGEKGIDMLKSLGKMFLDGTNRDVSLSVITIAGIISGGAGLISVLSKNSRKVMISNARDLGVRQESSKFKKTRKIASNIQKKANKYKKNSTIIDNSLSGIPNGLGPILAGSATLVGNSEYNKLTNINLTDGQNLETGKNIILNGITLKVGLISVNGKIELSYGDKNFTVMANNFYKDIDAFFKKA